MEKEINFKKVKNRYVLKPRERVLILLNKYKEMPISALARQSNIQFDTLKRMLIGLTNEGLTITMSQKLYNGDDLVLNYQTVKYLGGKLK